MDYALKIAQLRSRLTQAGSAGAMLTTTDNILYATGFSSVMDGWHLIEPIAAVFVPTSADEPVTLFMPEASLVSLITSERGGHPVFYERIRTYDMLNFCETARGHDAHLDLPEDLTVELAAIAQLIEGQCAENIMLALQYCLKERGFTDQVIMFDDLRVATRLAESNGQRWQDALDVMLSTRAIKTPAEIALLEESGVIADKVIAHTVSQLGIGKSWSNVEKSVAKFMIDQEVDPLPGSPMLFGGAYDLVFRSDLFRTPYDRPFEGGEIAIMETQGRYRGFWIDINRTAYIGTPPQAYRDQHACVTAIYATLVERLKAGANTAQICRTDNIPETKRLGAPDKLLVVAHSVGHVPLESPVAYPGTGWHAARDGFDVKAGMAISIDCLYFGSELGPSHMENVFIVTETGNYSLYQTPLDLIEVA
jgi:Xaa-Pro aminopeptidase